MLDDTLKEYWRSRLRDLPYAQLPTDYPRDVKHQIVESQETLSFDDESCLMLLRFSLTADIKPFTCVLAAFALLLRKYTREDDVVIGSSSSSSNPLVLRINLSPTDTLRQVVDRTKDAEEEAQKNDIPFDALLEVLRAERGPHAPATYDDDASSGLGLFPVRFLNVADVTKETIDAAACDWTVYLEQEADAKRLLPLRLRIVYNALLYSRERMSETLRQLHQLVRTIASSGDTPARMASVLTPAAITRLPNPRCALDATWHGSIFSILARRAAETPSRPLCVHGERTYTYGEINSMANRLAHRLIAAGIQKEHVCALYAHRSTSIVVGILGILKAGGTFTVIDPLYPVKRQTVYLSVARPRAIITLLQAGPLSPEVRSYIDEELDVLCTINNVDVDTLGPLEGAPETDPDVTVSPDNIGTLSFTSGSTGIPKGVRGRHISLTHFYPWMSKEFDIGEHDRFTMLSGIAHDPIQRDVFTPIFYGAQIRIPDAEDIGEPGRLARWMAHHGCTVTHLTPAMGQLLTANAVTHMPALRRAFFVGDVLTKRDVMRLQALASQVHVINMYGTTETQRAVTFLTIRPATIESYKDIFPAGRGMEDAQLIVLADSGELAGVGELGELYMRSPHLSAGYLGLPEQTAAKFLTNPLTGIETDRLYRTGDLGRYLPDGVVECIGRADDQVKIRGFRIELGEIDTYLSQHPQVRENVTLVRRDAQEEKQIVSYFVSAVGDTFDLASIREHLRSKLPSYAIPSIIAPISRMPLTPNGKIDKKKLPYPDLALINMRQRTGSNASGTTDAAAATNDPSGAGNAGGAAGSAIAAPMRESLLPIWTRVLGRPVVVTDNFFDVGGHSILATRLTFEMREELRLELPLNLLYTYPTIAKLAEVLTAAAADPTIEMMDTNPTSSTSGADDSLAQATMLQQDVTLPADVDARGRVYTPPHTSSDKVRGVLLTGATGFLGCFLLRRLLDIHPHAHIHCLVRGSDSDACFDRLVRNMQANLVWKPEYGERIEVVRGDLGAEALGLEGGVEAYGALADAVDYIVHNGALVHWVFPYAKLRPMNVVGTVEILRVAAAGVHLKPVHFVSSTSVFDSGHYVERTEPVDADETIMGEGTLSSGYAQSKWVAERILLLARETRGMPVTIFRPGYIVAHSETGVSNADDYLIRLLKGCIELQAAPRMRNRVNMCSVDYVAAAIVHVATLAATQVPATPSLSPLAHCYHVVNPHPFTFFDFFQALIDYGFPVSFVDYVQWRDALMKLTLESKSNALYPLLHFVLDDLPAKSKSAPLSFATLSQQLEGSAIECPPVSSVMGILLAFLCRAGFLETPALAVGATRTLPFDALPVVVGELDLLRRSGH